MVLDVDKSNYVKESLGKKINRSSTRRMNTKNEEMIKDDAKVTTEKIKENKEELSLEPA